MSHKDLERLFKLCRKHGVASFQDANVTLTFDTNAPLEAPKASPAAPIEESAPELSEEDILNWSATPL